MASVVTVQDLPQMLLPGARSITLDYPYYMNEYKQFMTILPSVKREEIDIEAVPLSGGGVFADGQNMPQGSFYQYFVTKSIHKNYGNSFTITSNAVDDNLYPDQFPKGMFGLKENLAMVSEYAAIALFDNAFNATAGNPFLLADGQPMCSALHPISTGGTVSNALSPAQLTETSAEDMIKLINYFKDAAGMPRKFEERYYLVGVENQFEAEILTGSAYRPGDGTNSVNPLTYGEYVQGGFILSHYMANPANFFMLTNFKEGLVHYLRQGLKVQMTTDQGNLNLSVYASERYINRCINFRAVVGCQSFS